MFDTNSSTLKSTPELFPVFRIYAYIGWLNLLLYHGLQRNKKFGAKYETGVTLPNHLSWVTGGLLKLFGDFVWSRLLQIYGNVMVTSKEVLTGGYCVKMLYLHDFHLVAQ